MVSPDDADSTDLYYFFEKNRVKSFKSWPFSLKEKCNIQRMAEAGFYWCGTIHANDSACCFLCHKELDGWENSDDPWQEHKQHAPQCQFVKLGRPEKQLTLSEMLDLLDVYVNKLRSKMLDRVKKQCSEKESQLRDRFKNA